MALEILNITAPIFMLAAVGTIWARMGVPYDLAFVTRMGVQIAVPCLIFSVLATAEIEPGAFRDMALAALAGHALIWALLWPVLKLGGLPTSAFLHPMWFANTGNMGLAVALFAYGEPGLAVGMVFFAISAGLSFSLGVWVVARNGRSFEALRQPMVYACIAGAVFAWQGWRLPEAVMGGIRLIGQIGIPLMLITLGVSVASLKVGDIWRSVLLTAVKLAVCTVAALVIVVAFRLEGTLAGVVALQMIMPAGITSYIIAQRYGASPDAVAGLVVVSTVLSVVYVPAALAIVLG